MQVEKRYINSKTSTTFPTPQKTLRVLDTRRDKHTKKLESNNYAGTSPWKVFTASQGLENDQTIFFHVIAENVKFFGESMTKFSSIQVFVRNATLSL